MRNRYVIKSLSFILVIILLMSVCPTGYASTETAHSLSIGLNAFFEVGNDVKLTERTGTSHMTYVDDMRNSIEGSLAMEVLGLIYGTGAEPDEAKYMEVLINIMKTYETENASSISEQHQMDNLKAIEEYGMDVLDIGIGLIPSMKGVSQSTEQLGEWIQIAISGLDTMAGNTVQWIEGISDLETIIQNYAKHDAFLALIEAQADGALKNAASALRTSMTEAMKIKLEMYGDISETNFGNYTKYFFEDVFFEALKLTDLYEADSGFQGFVDLGASVFELWTALKVGYEIGKFVGNIAIGAEDVINRVLEMKAVYDISEILEGELTGIKQQFPNSYSDETDEIAQNYITYGNYLISSRIRGEYCMYSMLAKDAGLYSHFGDETAQRAQSVYNRLTAKLSEVQQSLDAIPNVLIVDVSSKPPYEAVNSNSEWYVYDVNGQLYDNYTLRVYDKQSLLEMVLFYEVEDIDHAVTEYVVNSPEPFMITLEKGCAYTFEFVDNDNPENMKTMIVGVTTDDPSLISMVDVETSFGNVLDLFTYVDAGSPTAALTQNGDLYMWGENNYGQIGNGTAKDQLTAQKIMRNISYVTCSGSTTAAIDKNGGLYMWGDNEYGTAGIGTAQSVYLPTKVLDNVKSVQFGGYTVYAITNDGDLYAWGKNTWGQVGNGNEADQMTPYKVMSGIIDVVWCGNHAFAISDNGDLYAWGFNRYGQLGNGSTASQSKPVKILGNVTSVCGNQEFSGAITGSGDLYMWGRNNYGQLGDGTTTDRFTPVKVLTDVVTFDVNEYQNALAITSDNSLYVWGYNYYGQVGNGTEKIQNKPVKILANVVYATIEYANAAAITAEQELYIWGDNFYGQVGNGNGGSGSAHQTTPVKVMDNVRFVMFPSSQNVQAITLLGELYSWGKGENGEIGNGETSNQIAPVFVLENVAQIYSQGACMNAITNDGKLFVWGYNMYGQMGNGSTKNQLTPYEIDISDIHADPIVQPEIQEVDSGVYTAFLEEKGYLPFIDDSGLFGEPSGYAVVDIDQDGAQELLLNADDGFGFCMTYVFSMDNTTQGVTLIDSIYSYSGINYSESNQCITYCDLKPTAMEGGLQFVKLSDGELVLSFGVYYSDYDHYLLIRFSPDGSIVETITLTETQWEDYVNSDSPLDWQSIS